MECHIPQQCNVGLHKKRHKFTVVAIYVSLYQFSWNFQAHSYGVWRPPASCPAGRKVRSGCNWGGLTGGASTPYLCIHSCVFDPVMNTFKKKFLADWRKGKWIWLWLLFGQQWSVQSENNLFVRSLLRIIVVLIFPAFSCSDFCKLQIAQPVQTSNLMPRAFSNRLEHN